MRILEDQSRKIEVGQEAEIFSIGNDLFLSYWKGSLIFLVFWKSL